MASLAQVLRQLERLPIEKMANNDRKYLKSNLGRFIKRRFDNACSVMVRNFMWEMRGNKIHTETLNLNQQLGDWIQQILNLEGYSGIRSFYIIVNSEKKYFGYDLNLLSTFSDYASFDGFHREVTIFTHSALDWTGTQYNILHPLAYYKQNESWPPVKMDDWKNGDPINLAPFLIWDGYGAGATSVDEKLDNAYKNLVILKYPNDVKKIVNSYSYLMSIVSTDKKDALTNKKIKISMISKLLEAINLQRYKCKHHNYNDVLLPIVKIEFENE